MFRWLGAGLLLGGGVCAGVLWRARLIGRARQCEAFLALIETVRTQVDHLSAPVERILAGCREEILSDCGWPAGPRPRDLGELLRGCRLLLPEDVCRLLTEFADRFGGNYRAAELRCCEYYAERLAAAARDLRAEADRRGRAALLLPPALCAVAVLALC